ncbi:hypothetical protein CTM_19154 [Clostridium tetanomorphum DSM 665]|nr:hypothetical protein CTM_19154 [Clostridium tetanomorphum DSM 665]
MEKSSTFFCATNTHGYTKGLKKLIAMSRNLPQNGKFAGNEYKTFCRKLHMSMVHFSRMWLILKDVEKPKDGQYKDN